MDMIRNSWNTILQFYQNYIGNGLVFFLFLASMLYLLFAEKRGNTKTILVFSPIVIMMLFSFPPFQMLFELLGLDSETYYRILWLLPMGIVIAYAGIKLFEEYVWVGIAVMCALVIYTGTYVYKNPNITKAENGYHIPQMVINVCDVLLPEEGSDKDRVWAVFPSEFIHYVRQYSDVICMPYGREALVDRWEFEYPLKELMEAGKIQTEELVEALRNSWCEYVVLSVNKEYTEPMEDYGFELVDTVNGYHIYRDSLNIR